MKLTFATPEALEDWLGKEIAVTDWLRIAQERIQQFAETSGDLQWIHTDVERASRESPFRTTIAHGFLTLSLLTQFLHNALEVKGGFRMAINYGLNRVRFVSPVRSETRIRARFTLQAFKKSVDSLEAVFLVHIEAEGADKPCCVAEWIVRYYT